MLDWQQLRSSAHVIVMIEYARDMAYPIAELLWGTGIDIDALDNPAQEVITWQEIMVLRNLVKLDSAPESLGLRIGKRFNPGRLRMLGMAMITSATLGEALTRLERMSPLGLSFGRFVARDTEKHYQVTLEVPPLPGDILPLVVQRGLSGTAGLYSCLTGRDVSVRECHLMQQEPEDTGPFLENLCQNITFGAHSNYVAFDRDIWDLPLPNADAVTAQLCQAAFMQTIRDRKSRSGLAGDLRISLQSRPSDIPDMAEMAADLGITERTLRRRLNNEGTSYRAIIDQVRADQADIMLLENERKIDEIAVELGFSDPASFIRAYRRWTGKTPRGKVLSETSNL